MGLQAHESCIQNKAALAAGLSAANFRFIPRKRPSSAMKQRRHRKQSGQGQRDVQKLFRVPEQQERQDPFPAFFLTPIELRYLVKREEDQLQW